jgi:hypothetical protein
MRGAARARAWRWRVWPSEQMDVRRQGKIGADKMWPRVTREFIGHARADAGEKIRAGYWKTGGTRCV